MAARLECPPRRTEFETTDPDLAHEQLLAAYDHGLRMSGFTGARPMRHRRTEAGAFAVDDLALPLDLAFSADELALMILQVESGHVERTLAGVENRIGPGDVLVHTQPAMKFRARTIDVVCRPVRLDTALFNQITTAPSGLIRFTGYRPRTPGTAAHWKRTVHYLNENLRENPEAAGHELVLGNTARLLAATALATFPNTAVIEPNGVDRHDAGPAALRRAIAYLEEHADEDVVVADLARAARVTIRAVQLAFRRHLDTTPMAYLRRVRLEHAHRELRDADPARETVAAVAARWGFANPGRFAAYYRVAFGVTPARTLRG
ncbi:helix-turn-helix transcriptional regulator [Actinokineospora enzanensis]|uniref:helix-turn-helix transcriptional regulator n=1 Tax=Actinokineospora enzanensis TaxID=155975 RepID=UPI000360384A|nr:helix-turn-helix transcriptional regulator [Actinokineospora enzanensis]